MSGRGSNPDSRSCRAGASGTNAHAAPARSTNGSRGPGAVEVDERHGEPIAVDRIPADWPDRAVVAAGLARVRAVIDRIAVDVGELARARRVEDLDTAAVLPGRRAERRRRLAEPDLEFRAFWGWDRNTREMGREAGPCWSGRLL
jgi:hypothetical protein